MTRRAHAVPRAVIVHGVTDATRPDEADTLEQVREVGAALRNLGFDTSERALGLDLSPLAVLGVDPPDVVFNLVEALAGDGRLIQLAPAVMEHLGLVFTGSSATAVAVTTDKPLTKRLLQAAGVPVPATFDATAARHIAERYIVKSLAEDASFGIDEASVVLAGEAGAEIERRRARYGGAWFAEEYIEGREFNISLIVGDDGYPRVLPAAEIEFVGYSEGRPRIVDYAAKWDASSAGYHATPRRFVSRSAEPGLVEELERLSLAAWRVLGLGGYARVDFRVAEDGRCLVLEANANPCLSPDAGFAAAAAQAGLTYDAMIEMIVGAARRNAAGGASDAARTNS
ncbi:MAG: ATP-grasp domain-containing protein [Hyphomicrobiaceae bacterium]